jgi:hypothetical protein
MALSDLQQQIRKAVVGREGHTLKGVICGGVDPLRRLAIHRRHHRASLSAVITGRFRATAWLIGPSRLEEAACQFIACCPPTMPCMAEYGAAFPAFLRTWQNVARLEYVADFADLDFHLGRLSVCVDEAAIRRADLAAAHPEDLLDARVALQNGCHYIVASWPLDELITLYLHDAAPTDWELTRESVTLQVRGSRGVLQFQRLDPGTYVFRTALADGGNLGEAATLAMGMDPCFDPGAALMAAIDEQLVTSLGGIRGGSR